MILGGCLNTATPPVASTLTVAPPTPTVLPEVLPGIYVSNDPADFPYPTSGYTIYIVGETHGNQETKLIFQAYLQRLYTEAGLRDVVLEEDQGYETDANAYVQRLSDELPTGLCLRADILGQIREFNGSHPADEQVLVQLVDLDSPFPIIYRHLAELHSQIGAAAESIQIPELDEFRAWQPAAMYELIDKLRNASKGQPDILNGLDTVYQSIQWYLNGNEVDTGALKGSPESFFPAREDVITQNVQYLVHQLEGKPVLAFFGAAHGMKKTTAIDFPIEGFKSWGQRLNEANVSIYSMRVDTLFGEGYWRGDAFTLSLSTEDYQFEDGSSLVSLFEKNPDTEIMYTDLRLEDNSDIQLPSGYPSIPASQVYDGLIIFREFTPMEDACPQ